MRCFRCLAKGKPRRSIAQELLAVVNEAYTSSRGCDPQVWEKIAVNKQPIQAEIDQALAAFQSASPKQKTLTAQLQNVIAALESHEFELLAESTLLANIASARRTQNEVKFGRSQFPDGLDEAFDTLYAAIRRPYAGTASQPKRSHRIRVGNVRPAGDATEIRGPHDRI